MRFDSGINCKIHFTKVMVACRGHLISFVFTRQKRPLESTKDHVAVKR